MARADSVDERGTKAGPPVGKVPTEPMRHTGSLTVIVVYVIATTALAWAIYERFVR
ncbi:MAG: hypothetical protein H0T42_33715 [Deltaproteobacteria bacterium]|nr:hypothetical protein [Deltaproteobacteria bacterium]